MDDARLGSLSNRLLIREARKSEKAFNVLLKRLRPLIEIMACERSNDNGFREELIQIAIIRLWGSLGKIKTCRNERHVTNTLIAVVKRAMISEQRKAGTRARNLIFTDHDLSNAVCVEHSRTEETDQSELKTWLYRVRTELDDKHLFARAEEYIRERGNTQSLNIHLRAQSGRKNPVQHLRKVISEDAENFDIPVVAKRIVFGRKNDCV